MNLRRLEGLNRILFLLVRLPPARAARKGEGGEERRYPTPG